MSTYQQMQRDSEKAALNARMIAVASALQGKYALVREFDSLALIYILSADCLLTPGSQRLTAFDMNITALVYSQTSSSNFVLSSSWKTFVAYDIVSLFASPFPAAVASRQQSLLAPASWTQTMAVLSARASEPGRGGLEGLQSVFADEHTMASLLRTAGYAMTPTPRPCAGRRESFGISPLSMQRVSLGH